LIISLLAVLGLYSEGGGKVCSEEELRFKVKWQIQMSLFLL
jgi:hypothetical protein